MVSVVEELKRKLAEVDAQLAAIRKEAAALEGQRAAFETVISVYDPAFTATTRAKADRSTPTKRVTDLLKGKDVRGGILIALRDAEEPLRASDIAQSFVTQEGIEVAADGLTAHIAGRFSGMLDRLGKDGLIRSVETGGRHRAWEIAR